MDIQNLSSQNYSNSEKLECIDLTDPNQYSMLQRIRVIAGFCFVIRCFAIAFYFHFIIRMGTKKARILIDQFVYWYISLGIADLWYLTSRGITELQLVLQPPLTSTAIDIQAVFIMFFYLYPMFSVYYQMPIMAGVRLIVVCYPFKFKDVLISVTTIGIFVGWLIPLIIGSICYSLPGSRIYIDWEVYCAKAYKPEESGILIYSGIITNSVLVIISLVLYLIIYWALRKQSVTVNPAPQAIPVVKYLSNEGQMIDEPQSQNPVYMVTILGQPNNTNMLTDVAVRAQRAALFIGFYISIASMSYFLFTLLTGLLFPRAYTLQPLVNLLSDIIFTGSNPLLMRFISPTIKEAAPFPKLFKFCWR